MFVAGVFGAGVRTVLALVGVGGVGSHGFAFAFCAGHGVVVRGFLVVRTGRQRQTENCSNDQR